MTTKPMSIGLFYVNCFYTAVFLGGFAVLEGYGLVPDLTPLGNLAIWLGPIVYIWTRHRLRRHAIEGDSVDGDRVSWVDPILPDEVRKRLSEARIVYLEGQLHESQKELSDL